MEVHLNPEVEARIERLAGATGTTAGELVGQLLERYLDHDEWFRLEVQKGIDQADRGELLEHDEVVARIERHISSKTR